MSLRAPLKAALRAVVAIPVCNERERIAACLMALANQRPHDHVEFGVLLFLNNCTDGTGDLVASLIPRLPCPVRVMECEDAAASAGWARRHAMQAASQWLAEVDGLDGVLLTTDADSRVASDWITKNLAYIDTGYDAVTGRIALDPAEAALLPDALHARGRKEAAYEALLTEIDARIDPQPTDPWPCHWTQSGACIAVRRSAYDHVGGMPDLALGEDQAFIDLLKAHDLRVRHAMDIEVVTSGRLAGRASGGAADTMKLRCDVPESPCDDRLERLDRAVLRFAWRRALRCARADGALKYPWFWAVALGMPINKLRSLTRLEPARTSQATIEALSPALSYRPLSPAHLPRQIKFAKLLLALLRLRSVPKSPAFAAGQSIIISRPSVGLGMPTTEEAST